MSINARRALWVALPLALAGCTEPEAPDLDGSATPADAFVGNEDGGTMEPPPVDASTSPGGSVEDSGMPADAAPPSDAATMDGSTPDAGDTSSDLPDAGFSSEMVCMDLVPWGTGPDRQCPARKCMPARSTFVVTTGTLTCMNNPGCKLPSDPGSIGEVPGGSGAFYSQPYQYTRSDLSVWLNFNNEILRGYTLETLQRHVAGGGANAQLPVDGVSTMVFASDTQAEILGYQNGVMRFRVAAEVPGFELSVKVPPYWCTVGPLPTFCTDAPCHYALNSAAGVQKPQIIIEGNLPIEQPTP